MNTNLAIPLLGFLTFLLFTSCIKDTDFDQAYDIALTPEVELDLIYFNLRARDFYDTITSSSILTVRDTTDLRFLDDGEIQDNLRRAEFFFEFTNTIPRNFNVDFQFLSEANDTTYTTQTQINSGAVGSPVVTEFIENIEGDAIADLTRSFKVVVSVTIPSSSATLEGELDLKSKTTYYLEF
ncbi:hypothetical protein [Ulvibacter antarcticus]|uniref:DUF4270 family protein n=1 Tax=Ulvibacter antarcticus TaxID=442714 RepID=A0A3L9YGV3_9FLAO|nr:hypothetical protein [Ulvibacter antarcticus]RMA57108.1 hypothetical protein BXY75_2989 [Ulvibacter antarcticus]